jgi:hypothetical protein
LNRRRLLGLTAAAAASPFVRPLLPFPAYANAGQDLRFRVLRDGAPVGEHRVRFTLDGDLLIVATQVEIAVKVLLMTVYRFRHQAQEIWGSGRLLWVQSTTDDNGRLMKVQGEAAPDGFRIIGEKGPFLASSALLTSNSFWDRRIVREKRLIDVQHGGDVGLVTKKLDDEQVTTPQGRVRASRHQMITPYNAGIVFHDADGRWVKALLEIKGESIEYVLSA